MRGYSQANSASTHLDHAAEDVEDKENDEARDEAKFAPVQVCHAAADKQAAASERYDNPRGSPCVRDAIGRHNPLRLQFGHGTVGGYRGNGHSDCLHRCRL
jgi:hypothetical protein